MCVCLSNFNLQEDWIRVFWIFHSLQKRDFMFFCSCVLVENSDWQKIKFLKRFSSLQNEATRFWSVLQVYKMKKHVFEAFFKFKNEETSFSRREIHILDLHQGGKKGRFFPPPTRFCQYFREFLFLCPGFFTSVKCEVKRTFYIPWMMS